METIFNQTLCQLDTNPANLQTIAQQVTDTLNVPELTPLRRYAIAKTLLNGLSLAVAEIGAAGLQYALDNYPSAQEGTHFSEGDDTFRINIKTDYNYAANDNSGLYNQQLKRETECKKMAEAAHKLLKGMQAQILADHPRMTPTKIEMTLAYVGQKMKQG